MLNDPQAFLLDIGARPLVLLWLNGHKFPKPQLNDLVKSFTRRVEDVIEAKQEQLILMTMVWKWDVQ